MRSNMYGSLIALALLLRGGCPAGAAVAGGTTATALAGANMRGGTGMEHVAQAHGKRAGGADVELATPADLDRVDLGAYRWKRRLLLIFAPSANVSEYVRQEGLLAGHRAQLADRDVTEGAFFLRGRGHLGAAPISATGAAALRAQRGVEGGRFTVLLVGKGGGIKLTLAGLSVPPSYSR